MVRIVDLIGSRVPGDSCDCKLTVGGDEAARDVLLKMQEQDCDFIAVDDAGQTDKQIILSKDEVLQGLLAELNGTQDKLRELYTLIDNSLEERLDSIRENVVSDAEKEINKLKLAVDNMSEGLVILGPAGEIENANPAAKKLLGLNDDADLEALAAAIDDFGFRRMLERDDNGANVNRGQLVVKNAIDRILRMQWTEMADESDYFTGQGSVVTIRDITDEIAAEKTKTEFVSAISHELRTPITSMQNAVSNMLAGVTGKVNVKMKTYLDAMKDDCHRYADLINDMLDVASIEAGDMSIFRRVVNISTVINDTVSKFADIGAAKNIRLSCNIDHRIRSVYVDPQRISQILDNLLTNAIKFTPEDGEITVTANENDEETTITVEDSGIGISPEMQQDIFSKFNQIDRQAGAGYNGSGLGLTICKGIIALHGGRMWVESDTGSGSKFCFSIPATDPSIILNKYLDDLQRRYAGTGNKLALIITRFETADTENPQVAGLIGPLTEELLTASDHFMGTSDDLAIQTKDFEVTFIIADAEKTRIQAVLKKINEIVKNRIRNNCGQPLISPMSGIALYQGDSCNVRDLEKIARGNIEAMF